MDLKFLYFELVVGSECEVELERSPEEVVKQVSGVRGGRL